MKTLNTHISLKHPFGGPVLIGGLLILRLVSPAIICPWKFDFLCENKLSIAQQRTLVLVAKIIQNLANGANEADNYMKVTSLWIKRNLFNWTSFFQKLIGTECLLDDFKTVKMTPEDIVAISNHNVKLTENSNQACIKQLELIKNIFQLEQQTEDWKTKKKGPLQIYFKRNQVFLVKK